MKTFRPRSARNLRVHLACLLTRSLTHSLKPIHQGTSNTKLNIKSIKVNLSKFDVVCLEETWAKDDFLAFEGYTEYSIVRSCKSKRGQGRGSVLIKNIVIS